MKKVKEYNYLGHMQKLEKDPENETKRQIMIGYKAFSNKQT